MSKRRPSGDGLIRKRNDGRWEGRIVVGHKSNRKPIYRSVFAKTQKELMPKLNALKEKYSSVELTEQSRITLEEWLDKWINEIKAPLIRASTLKKYKKDIENHIKPYLGKKLITSIKTSDIQKLYNNLKSNGRKKGCEKFGNGLSSAMIRNVHLVLHQAFDSAVKEGITPSNPTDNTTLPKIIKTEKTVLLSSQIETFLKSIEDETEWHDFFLVELMTGLRRGEICGLKYSDFDEENKTLHVRRTIRYSKNELIVGETKTNEGNRKIALPSSVSEVLKERKEKAITEWIFPKPHHLEQPISPQTAYTKLKNVLKKSGLPDMRFHDLRHTFATHAASSGIDPKTLSSILGHTKASFTLDTYTHVTTDMQRQASSIVENYITDIFGKELKPWQEDESTEQAQ